MLSPTKFCFIVLMVAAGSQGAMLGHQEQDNNPKVDPLSGATEKQQESKEAACMKTEHSINTQDSEGDEHQSHAVHSFLAALSRWREPGEREDQLFGICSTEGSSASHLEVLHLKQSGIQSIPATKESWDANVGGEMTLKLTFPKHSQRIRGSSSMLLFSVGAVKGGDLRVTFNSDSVHPKTQTVCITENTRFLVLTLRASHVDLMLSVTLETSTDDNGPKLGVSELQDVLTRKDGSGKTSPTLLILSERQDQQTHGSAQEKTPHSTTFRFLCELQTFLQEVLPQNEVQTLEDEASSVSLDALHSLPPLTLGESSTGSLLSGLVSSSMPTVFVFPQRQQGLQTHRVEVMLDSPLLSILKLRLTDAMARVKQQEAGQKMTDRLDRLTQLSMISPVQQDEEVSSDFKEAQYRSVLLLKALQTVLRVWEAERSERAARADEDPLGSTSQCRLHSFSVSLRKFFLEPSKANINNCEGMCGFPLNKANNHAVLLNSHIQSGLPVNRSLCCVPVDYDDLCVIELESDSTNISFKTNVVATKCECR